MKEIEEIRLIENEAFLDKAILEIQKIMAEMLATRSEIDRRIHECEIHLGECLAHKAMFALGRGRSA